MADESILRIVRDMIGTHSIAWRPVVTLDSELDRDLLCDGIERAAISLAIEDEFHIRITDAQIDAWENVSDIVATVQAKTKEKIV